MPVLAVLFLACTSSVLAASDDYGVPDTHACFDSFKTRDMFDWRGCLDDLADDTYNRLKSNELNIVTAESLTAGMIAATLVDLAPGYGSYVYGGHAVYDSDAKRQFLGVTQGDVYTEVNEVFFWTATRCQFFTPDLCPSNGSWRSQHVPSAGGCCCYRKRRSVASGDDSAPWSGRYCCFHQNSGFSTRNAHRQWPVFHPNQEDQLL